MYTLEIKSTEVSQNLPLGITGLGGWLILVQIGIYSSLVKLLGQLIKYLIPAVYPSNWSIMVNSEMYHPEWGATIIFELFFSILLFVYCIYLLIIMYRKKSIFPRLMIIFYSVGLIGVIVDFVLVSQITFPKELEEGNPFRDIVRSSITCAIWIPYFIKSQRVKNTFIR